jgi:molecular chaperone HscB
MSSNGTAAAAPDYFAFFALPRKLKVDVAALEQAFYRKSRELHPDRYASAPAEKQQWSLEQSSLLNDAYRTLKQPLARTEYLLRLEGVQLADETTKAQPPAELLEEVFELNMQLDEMRESRAAGQDDPQLRRDLEAARDQWSSQLVDLDLALEVEWARWDAALDATDAAAGTDAKARMAALLDRRRYVRNLVRDVNEALA